jgi:photosystem II stability/assembly factor-like uncharacterized protein
MPLTCPSTCLWRPAALAFVLATTFALATTFLWAQPDAGLHGPIRLIQADPHRQGTLLAGTATARLFRSRDGGDTWSPLPFPPELRSTLHAILIDPGKANVYWVGVSSETPQFAGAFRSADEGANWQPVPGLERKQVWALAGWKVDAHVMAAGTEDGVYLTRNGGADWTLLSSPGASPHPVVSLAFDPADVKTLYAGTPHLAWKTVDGGATWQPIHKGMKDDSDIFSLDVNVTRRSRLFAGSCNGVYRSVDGGGTWTNLEHALGGPFRTYAVQSAPDRPEVVYAGTSLGLMVSRDSGANWSRLSATGARSVAFDPSNPQRLFVATDEGVLRWEDGAQGRLRAANPQ